MKTAVATDTNSSILRGENPDIHVMPMPVIIDGETYFEGVDICNQDLYEAMRQHKDIATSQPSPGQLMEFWDGILAAGYDEIVYIPMSSGLSGSCHSAMQFAADYGDKIQVVDNHRISVTQRESVYAALRLVDQGISAKEIKSRLEERAYDASIYVTVDSLEYLKKGGRITPTVAAFATVLNIKPVLTIQGDRLDSYVKARGIKHAESSMIRAIREDRSARFADVPDSQLQIDVAGSFESEESAQQWQQMVQTEFADASVRYVELPCCINCHVGMNAFGIAIMRTE
ncbi:MAG: DegV family protein [Clostridium sp.]|nr:DegV family protein [Acetatifactor muris]MCM1525775.1 DegV family protein [Bacteroides sp.]MCM1564071.1 DegV family protein [Clostridium sp.]